MSYYFSDEWDIWVEVDDATGQQWEVDPSTAALLDDRAYVQQETAQQAAADAAAREAAEVAAVQQLLRHNAQLLADRGEVNAENPSEAELARVIGVTQFQAENRGPDGHMVDSDTAARGYEKQQDLLRWADSGAVRGGSDKLSEHDLDRYNAGVKHAPRDSLSAAIQDTRVAMHKASLDRVGSTTERPTDRRALDKTAETP